jgi:hypothetical protein
LKAASGLKSGFLRKIKLDGKATESGMA